MIVHTYVCECVCVCVCVCVFVRLSMGEVSVCVGMRTFAGERNSMFAHTCECAGVRKTFL